MNLQPGSEDTHIPHQRPGFKFQSWLPANTEPGGSKDGSLPLSWVTWVEFLAPSCSLTPPWLVWVGGQYLFVLSLRVSLRRIHLYLREKTEVRWKFPSYTWAGSFLSTASSQDTFRRSRLKHLSEQVSGSTCKVRRGARQSQGTQALKKKKGARYRCGPGLCLLSSAGLLFRKKKKTPMFKGAGESAPFKVLTAAKLECFIPLLSND